MVGNPPYARLAFLGGNRWRISTYTGTGKPLGSPEVIFASSLDEAKRTARTHLRNHEGRVIKGTWTAYRESWVSTLMAGSLRGQKR